MQGLRLLVKGGRLKHFAIANPEHAPYGRAARVALVQAGLWEKIRPQRVFGGNISQAAQFALSRATQGGLLAYSLVRSPPFAGRSKSALVPANWHRPFRQRMALLKGAGQAARRFYLSFNSRPLRPSCADSVLFHRMGNKPP